MKIRRFYAKDMREALNQVKAELGGDAVIMSNKKVADGVEIVAAYDNEPVARSAGNKSATSSNDKATGAPLKVKATPTLSEVIGESGSDSLRALLEKQYGNPEEAPAQSHEPPVAPAGTQESNFQINKQRAQAQTQAAKARETRIEATLEAKVNTQPVDNSQASVKRQDAAIASIQNELKSLRNVLQFQVNGLLEQEQRRGHPLQSYLVDRLQAMGISPTLAQDVVSYAPESANEREAWLFILKLLANRLRTTNNDILTQSGVVAFMGPTGTGKTTTIAKLAAQYARKYGQDQVALVTIDSYRIAAYEQLATYGKIIGCSVKKAANAQELSDVLYQFRNKRLVLIDTAGFGQRDSRLIKQLDTLKETACANIKMYMVMQANTQRQVMERTLAMYSKLPIQGCIFTKLDECFSLGEAISVAIQERMPIAYLTDGQRVPEDLRVAEAKYLISLAAKLYKRYELPHTSSKPQKHSAVAV